MYVLLGKAGDIWHTKIVGDCVDLLRTFLCENASSLACSEELGDAQSQVLVSKDLWTQYICEVSFLPLALLEARSRFLSHVQLFCIAHFFCILNINLFFWSFLHVFAFISMVQFGLSVNLGQ